MPTLQIGGSERRAVGRTIAHSAPTIGPQECAAAIRVLQSGCIAQGAEVEAFEAECAAYANRRYAVAVNSGTAALHLALAAFQQPGVPASNLFGGGVSGESHLQTSFKVAPTNDLCGTGFQPVRPTGGRPSAERTGWKPVPRVLLPSYACASLVTACHLAGATPVLADVDKNFLVNPETAPAPYDAAIIPHLFGAQAPMPNIPNIIEDAAQSFGPNMQSTARVTVVSFYATKLMTTGEGGMILTDDEGIAESARDRRAYDNRDDYCQRYPYKMTDIAAAIGRVQLRRLERFHQRRQHIAAYYTEHLRHLPVTLPCGDNHAYFRYVVATPRRDALADHLAACGVEAKRPVHKPAHQYFAQGDPRVIRAAQYPGSDRAQEDALSLPIHPNLSDTDAAYITHAIAEFFAAAERSIDSVTPSEQRKTGTDA